MTAVEGRPTSSTDVATLQREVKAMRRTISDLQQAIVTEPMKLGAPNGRIAIVDATGAEVGSIGWLDSVLTISLPAKVSFNGGVPISITVATDGDGNYLAVTD